MPRTLFAAASLLVIAISLPISTAAAQGKTVEVKLLDVSATEYRFEPSTITVNQGDVVKFIQTTTMMHNVDFRTMPAGVDLGANKTSEYLMTPGQTYEVKIDKRFAKGTYGYVCTPHELMGMKGTIIVVGGTAAATKAK